MNARRRARSTYDASSGVEIGPPWQSTITSSRTDRAAADHVVDAFDAVDEGERGLGADRAAGREAHVADDDVGTGFGHGHRVVAR